MEVFPAYCESCKRLDHLRGECSSTSLSNPQSHLNPVFPVGNANSNALVISSLVVNEEGAGGFSNIVGLPVDSTVPIGNANRNVLVVSSLVGSEEGVGGIRLMLALWCKLLFLWVLAVMMDLGLRPLGLKEGTCNNLGNVGNDSTVLTVGAMCPIPCLVNHVSTPIPSPINVDVDDEEEFCSDSICDALAIKGVEVSYGVVQEGTEVRDAVSPLVNLAVPITFLDIPISVVSNAELKAHLALSQNNSCLDHSDWLNVSDGDVDENANDFQDSQDMYNFMAGRVVDPAVSSGAGKRSKSKSKKKY
ncbi:hypothetical protein IEQ34_020937 [Dendrobium chrysotoxum]|uniref:Uncharacterized protein n=1 Tax=Dendrobium chrysotoxum TaxID=161865 RepID=A0AAV7G3B7_DENCH|nr:hypothetical protein IEQ34_020937 [Dendrobium chrysotoxum]